MRKLEQKKSDNSNSAPPNLNIFIFKRYRMLTMVQKKTSSHEHGTMSALYTLGFVGTAWYYISTATGFWMGAFGILKAIVWPAILVYKLFVFLGL